MYFYWNFKNCDFRSLGLRGCVEVVWVKDLLYFYFLGWDGVVFGWVEEEILGGLVVSSLVDFVI